MTAVSMPISNPAAADAEFCPQADRGWWRGAAMYQVYVRSFCDVTGDGIGDLEGVRSGLSYLAELGVDGIWLNPCFPSPQRDHGYDVADYCGIEPAYGTLETFDGLIADAHDLGLRVLLDLVPNHCSTDHPLFQRALAAGPGSVERTLFHFATGRGTEPPNNWRSIFGSSVWTQITESDGHPEQWYLHTFTPGQPDWNWRHPEVRGTFENVLHFWLDRGVDGFRIDAAGALYKHPELPDADDPHADEREAEPSNRLAWGRPELHDLYRSWRAICDTYAARDGSDRVLVGEISGFVANESLHRFLRVDELHQAFLFELLDAPWEARTFGRIIRRELANAAPAAGSVAWVLGNHDRTRVATRYSADPARGLARARAAALLQFALPGPVYLYQGDELGLPEVADLPDHVLTDPIFHRTGGERRGRDGCRVPMPWHGDRAPFGFSADGEIDTWLPQPTHFADLTVERQRHNAQSTWQLYRQALALRRTLPQLAGTDIHWRDLGPDVLAFSRGSDFTCIVNMSDHAIALPRRLRHYLTSDAVALGTLPPDRAVWTAGL
jgi:alpha-glucosidase